MENSQNIETLILNHLKNGGSLDDFIIAPKGLQGRSLEEDIISIKPFGDNSKSDKESVKKVIEIRREGIFDALPEGVFFDIVQEENDFEKSKPKKIEKEARTFFMPLEQEFYKTRTATEYFERSLIDGHPEYFDTSTLSSLWDIDPSISQDDQRRLIQVLPYVPHITGDLIFTENCFEFLLGRVVQLNYKFPKITTNQNHSTLNTLGNTALGKDSILYGDYFDGSPVLELKIPDVDTSEMVDFLPEGKKNIFIQKVAEFIIPLEVDFEISIELKKETDEFKLAKETHRLGYANLL